MQRRTHRRNILAGTLGIVLSSTRLGTRAASAPAHTFTHRLQEQGPDWQAVAQALGATGALMKGDVFRVGMPRTDLDVTVKDVSIKPAFALGSYAAFKQVGPADDAIVMGDLVLLDAEVNAVMSGLFTAGLEITGVHNHLNELDPHVMYMHYMGHGSPIALAEGIRQALSASATPLGEATASSSGSPQAQATPVTDLDVPTLEETLGYSGKVANGAVVGFSVPRAETIMEGDLELIPSLGVATVLNFQPIEGGQAAITGDFLLLGEEVNPVAHVLRENDIEVHALHNHHLAEEPRYFYMHFFAAGDPVTLAYGLRAALDQTNSAES
jgi:hypothetical protein